MKKTLLIALCMAGVLFLYGYFASSVGHDHSAHGGENDHHVQGSADSSEESQHTGHGEHEHSH